MVSWFYDLLKPQYGYSPLRDRITNFVVLGLRKVLIAMGVRFVWRDDVKGQPIWLSFDDDFSINLRLYPDYGFNLARLASLCREKYPDLALIDIGSAIGDSIVQMRLYAKFPVLSINPGTAGVKRNFGDYPEVTIVDAFVSGKTTSNLPIPATPPGGHPTLALAQILDRHPAFKKARFLKVDTDGMDCSILRDNETLLRETRPVLFFEYDPRHAISFGDETLDIFPFLHGLGYDMAMVYASNGVFLFSTPVESQATWEELHHSLLRYNPISYLDICVFSREDRDVCAKARALELGLPTASRFSARKFPREHR